jgi:hypothetical protein
MKPVFHDTKTRQRHNKKEKLWISFFHEQNGKTSLKYFQAEFNNTLKRSYIIIISINLASF